jgi:two-component system, cell cycle response regulator DivK
MSTILVVDDHDDVRQSMVIRLEKHGFEVVVAKNGREAIEMVKSAKPSIVLMDMNMPEVDGWEASSLIKTDPEVKDIPIIALTAYDLPGDKARARQAGCEGYHAKPVELPMLLEQIRELIEQYRPLVDDK